MAINRSPSPLSGPQRNGKGSSIDKNARKNLDKVHKQMERALKHTGGILTPSKAKIAPPVYQNIFPKISLHPGGTPVQAWKGFLSWLRKLVRRAKEKLGKTEKYDPVKFWGVPENKIILTGYSSFLKGVCGPGDPVLMEELKNSLDSRGLREEIYCDVGYKSLEEEESEEEGCELECCWDTDWDTSSVGSYDSGYGTESEDDVVSLSESIASTCESAGEQVGGGEPIYVNFGAGNPPEHVPNNCFRCIFIDSQKGRGLNPGGGPVERLLVQLCLLYLEKEVENGEKSRIQALQDLSSILTQGSN